MRIPPLSVGVLSGSSSGGVWDIMARFCCWCIVLGTVALPGCSDAAIVVPVSGTVTLDDKPLTDGLVTFYPVGDTGGLGGFGTTGPDGKYKITPSRGSGGLLPGDYRVSVSRRL